MDNITDICRRLDLYPEVGIMAKADLIMLAEIKQKLPQYIGACIYQNAKTHHQARTFEDIGLHLGCSKEALHGAWAEIYMNFSDSDLYRWS